MIIQHIVNQSIRNARARTEQPQAVAVKRATAPDFVSAAKDDTPATLLENIVVGGIVISLLVGLGFCLVDLVESISAFANTI